jgi:hypothetical protein
MAESNREEWVRHLTPELRRHFETMGESIVEHDAVNHRYTPKENHFAALGWLAEKREQKAKREQCRFHMIFWTALATLIATVIGIILTMK